MKSLIFRDWAGRVPNDPPSNFTRRITAPDREITLPAVLAEGLIILP